MKNRRGIFRIGREILEGNEWLMLKVMAEVIIVKAEYFFMNDHIEYHAYSPKFRELPENKNTPLYSVGVQPVIDEKGYLVDYRIKFYEG